MKSITIEALAWHLVSAFLPRVVEERARGERILSVMDGAGEAHRRDVEAAIDSLCADDDASTLLVANALLAYWAANPYPFDELDDSAVDWVATALCDAGIALAAHDGWRGSTGAESITATFR